jgi:hypothetical protein
MAALAAKILRATARKKSLLPILTKINQNSKVKSQNYGVRVRTVISSNPHY